MNSKFLSKSSIFFILILLMSSCLAHETDISACTQGESSGFILGLWHGFIAPFSFILSLFSESITVYDVNNNGGWYTFGFLLGIGAFTSGGSATSRKVRRKR